MKALKFGTIAAALLLFNACSKESGVSVQPESQLSADYTMVDLDEISAPQITGGVTDDFKLQDPDKHMDQTPCDRPCEKPGAGNRDGKGDSRPAKDEKHDLGAVLHKLDLSKEQIAAIQKMMHEHCMCIAEHLKKANEINRDILAKFNQRRAELVKAVKSNKITQAEFNQKLASLREEMVQALRKSNDKQIQIEVMRKCDEAFARNILSVLDTRQAEIFKKWLENHK